MAVSESLRPWLFRDRDTLLPSPHTSARLIGHYGGIARKNIPGGLPHSFLVAVISADLPNCWLLVPLAETSARLVPVHLVDSIMIFAKTPAGVRWFLALDFIPKLSKNHPTSSTPPSAQGSPFTMPTDRPFAQASAWMFSDVSTQQVGVSNPMGVLQ